MTKVVSAKNDPNWSHGSLAAKHGPKHNAWPRAKMDVRRWVFDHHGQVRSVWEVYGAGGLATDCWKHFGAFDVAGNPFGSDALEYLAALERWDYDAWDVDPYSNPFTALRVIGERATAERIGLFVTDGCLRKLAQIRGNLPREAVELMGWPAGGRKEGRWRKAWIYYHYPAAIRMLVEACLAPRYKIKAMVVVKGRGRAAGNYAGVVAVC